MQQRDEQRRLECSTEAVSLSEAWSWRRSRNPRLSAHATHSLARGVVYGTQPVTVLIGIAIGGSTTEMARSATVNDNVPHTMSEHFPREETVRNDWAPN
jgi:hypothetical protein